MRKIPTLRWIIGMVVAIVGLFAWSKINSQREHALLTNRQVALICTTDMATQFHIHPILHIIANGQSQDIPANIGIRAGCMNPLHTHDASGTIHVESPENRDFTLADFFAVWDQPFSKDQILSYKADGAHQITVTVNGASMNTYENTALHDRDHIVITYGEK